jgi:hypothetical protein
LNGNNKRTLKKKGNRKRNERRTWAVRNKPINEGAYILLLFARTPYKSIDVAHVCDPELSLHVSYCKVIFQNCMRRVAGCVCIVFIKLCLSLFINRTTSHRFCCILIKRYLAFSRKNVAWECSRTNTEENIWIQKGGSNRRVEERAWWRDS